LEQAKEVLGASEVRHEDEHEDERKRRIRVEIAKGAARVIATTSRNMPTVEEAARGLVMQGPSTDQMRTLSDPPPGPDDFDPEDPLWVAAMRDVSAELRRTSRRVFPKDPLRRTALVAEEAGECLKAGLDLTRSTGGDEPNYRTEIYTEAVHTAATALRLMFHMLREERSDDEQE
jgi:hypothetical protein